MGTYFRAFAIARYFASKGGFEIDLLCTGKEDREDQIQGVRVIQHRVGAFNPISLRGWNAREILKRVAFVLGQRKRYDFIYSFEYQPSVIGLALPLARRHRALHYNDWCDWYAGRHHKMRGIRFLQEIDSFLEEFPRKHVDRLTSICETLSNRARKCGVPDEKIILVREGADPAPETLPQAKARARLQIPSDQFLVVAMLDEENQVLRDGIAELAKLNPRARLAILGKPELAGNPTQNLLVPGRVSDDELHLWLSAADCAWLPLRNIPLNEGRMPHKIGHYRLYGLPLVTCPVSDIPLLGDPDIHLTECNAGSFARQTFALPPLDDERRARSKRDAQTRFEWDAILKPLLEQVRLDLKSR